MAYFPPPFSFGDLALVAKTQGILYKTGSKPRMVIICGNYLLGNSIGGSSDATTVLSYGPDDDINNVAYDTSCGFSTGVGDETITFPFYINFIIPPNNFYQLDLFSHGDVSIVTLALWYELDL